MSFEIIPLQNKEDSDFINEFSTFGEKQRPQEYRIGLTPPEHVKKLIRWAHSDNCIFWLIKEKKTHQTILKFNARICPPNPSQGTIGLFEIDLNHSKMREAFIHAINEVTNWFKMKGVESVVAPVDINTWFNYRFSIPGKKFFPRHMWEPTTPPEYMELFKSLHFNNYAHYQSVYFPYYKIWNYYFGETYLKKGHKKLLDHGFTLRPFDLDNFISKEVPLLYEIAHEAFQNAFMFEPIDFETFATLYTAAKSYDFSPSCVLISPEGETAGFLFAFYDGDYVVIKSLAIRKKFQGLKLSSGMIWSAVKQSFPLNKKATISALFKTGIASEKISNNSRPLWFSWSHDYVLLKKDLTHE